MMARSKLNCLESTIPKVHKIFTTTAYEERSYRELKKKYCNDQKSKK